MKRLVMTIVSSSLLLASCGTAEWQADIERGDQAIEDKLYEKAIAHYERSLDVKDKDETKEKLEKAKALKKAEDDEIAQKKKEQEKKEAEQKAREQEDEEKRERANKENVTKSQELQEKADQLVVSSEGLLLKVEPWKEHDWETVRVYVADEWYLLDDGEKKYLVEQIGPGFAALVAQSGLENDPAIYFYDKNMKELAKPNIWSGGWKIKN